MPFPASAARPRPPGTAQSCCLRAAIQQKGPTTASRLRHRPRRPDLRNAAAGLPRRPVAAFAGLTVGLLVLKMTRRHTCARAQEPRIVPALRLAAPLATTRATAGTEASGGPAANLRWPGEMTRHRNGTRPRPGLLRDASAIYQDAAARGERLSQRTLARQLRGHGHRFPNDHLRQIADSIGLTANRAA
jgi:hypothetical protein